MPKVKNKNLCAPTPGQIRALKTLNLPRVGINRGQAGKMIREHPNFKPKFDMEQFNNSYMIAGGKRIKVKDFAKMSGQEQLAFEKGLDIKNGKLPK